MSKLTMPQRAAMVVGLGLALWIVGRFITYEAAPQFGWIAYAPLSHAVNAPDFGGLTAVEQFLMWLGLTVIWTAASVFILRPPRENGN
jgi:hypothetical protein